MPIGLVVVSWWRFGGVELARGLTCSGWIVEAPRHVRTLGVALFRLWTTAEEDQGQCLRFVDTVNASDAPDRQDMPPTNHASASKPTSSTEWQLGTLNGLVEVVVVVYTDPPRVSSAQTTSTQRPARHATRVGRLDVVAVRRCGAGARTYVQRMDRRSPPSRQNAGGGAISTMDRCKGGVTAYACVS